MIASGGNPGAGSGWVVVDSVVLAAVVVLELVVDELVELCVLVEVELDVWVLPLDVVVDDSVVEEDVVDEVVVEVVLLICMSIDVPQCTSVPSDPAAQPSSDAMKLAL
jgi:hypothetical protein